MFKSTRRWQSGQHSRLCQCDPEFESTDCKIRKTQTSKDMITRGMRLLCIDLNSEYRALKSCCLIITNTFDTGYEPRSSRSPTSRPTQPLSPRQLFRVVFKALQLTGYNTAEEHMPPNREVVGWNLTGLAFDELVFDEMTLHPFFFFPSFPNFLWQSLIRSLKRVHLDF